MGSMCSHGKADIAIVSSIEASVCSTITPSLNLILGSILPRTQMFTLHGIRPSADRRATVAEYENFGLGDSTA
jgi:hypothetical protein